MMSYCPFTNSIPQDTVSLVRRLGIQYFVVGPAEEHDRDVLETVYVLEGREVLKRGRCRLRNRRRPFALGGAGGLRSRHQRIGLFADGLLRLGSCGSRVFRRSTSSDGKRRCADLRPRVRVEPKNLVDKLLEIRIVFARRAREPLPSKGCVEFVKWNSPARALNRLSVTQIGLMNTWVHEMALIYSVGMVPSRRPQE